MTVHKTTWVITVLLCIGAIAGLLAFLYRSNAGTPMPGAQATSSIGSVGTPGIDYDFVEPTSTTSNATPVKMRIPDLTRPIVVPKSFPPDVALAAENKLAATIDALKQDPNSTALWLDLGFHRKGIEDYEGARQAYAYALALTPTSALAADSLGVLYSTYLKEYPKAEQNFLLALKLDSTTPYRYLRLFEFYSETMNDGSKARAILEKGLKAIPGDASFTVLLESLN
ncbi:MAG: hypothetical protein A2849_00610 [Candidatus Taylorbacteria bacterium RIFCSPHIGHO2_01_FULL_51_15]|uniref:Uncharacterized protein n=1 Tax=Candidatus Taylorbacteria bacterium RIFCSPHIGHO2_01_FULL_51_15 TaxID=1802304 RepID=A0A1G2M9R5_9BACT|nr:MAG: hypothetical protein A2849_00610 [Candidatus Taylorbacteria bacterium RIFCSPHIGHO2_01_FULL_51_15]